MKTIPLYQYSDGGGLIVAHATVDDEDYNFLNQWFWSLHPTYEEVFREEGAHPVYMLDVVWKRAGRKGIPSHISANPLDNRRKDLTLAIPATSQAQEPSDID